MNKRLNKILASAMSAVMIFGGTINPAIGGLAVHADEEPNDTANAADAEAGTVEVPADGNETEQVPSTDEAQSQLGQNTEAAPADKADDFSSGRLIAITDDKSVFANDNAVISKYGDLYLLKYDSEEDAKQAYDSYKDQVKYIEPDVNVYSCDDQDKAEDTEGLSIEEGSTPLDAVKENESASLKKTLKSIKKTNSDKTVIALLDSGVHIDQQTSAENLAGSIDLTNSTDSGEYSHGDLMYSTIINEDPDASIVDVKVLGDDGIGSISSVAAGLAYAIDKDVDIINLSLSAYKTEENSVILSLIDEACGKGITVVGAAGNNRSDASKFVPGASEKAVIVNACDGDGKMRDFSNYGTTVDYSVEAGSTSEAAAKMTGILSKNMKKGVDPFSSLPSEVHTPEAITTSEDGTGYIDSTGAFHAAGNMILYVTIPYHYVYRNGERKTVYELTEDHYVSVPSGAGTYSTPGYTPSSVTFTASDTNTTKDVIRYVHRSANDVGGSSGGGTGGSSGGGTGGSSGGGTTSHNYVSDTIYLHPNGGSADDITDGGSGISLYSETRRGEAVKYCYTNSNHDTYSSSGCSTLKSGFDKITASRSGYKFDGWFTRATGGKQVTNNTRIYGDTDVYAHWSVNSYTMTYNANGGTGTMAGQSITGTANLNANAFTRAGYSFDKWNTKADGSGTAYTNQQSVTPTANMTLYAQWTPVTYSISYTLNGGVASGNPTSYKATDSDITLNNPAKTGYTFTGWTGSNGSTAQKSVTIAKGSVGDKTYIANWSANDYTASFANEGGTGGISGQVIETYDAKPKTVSGTVPTKAGYTFTGYGTKADGTGTLYYDEKLQPKDTVWKETADTTLHAIWTANKYTASFNNEGGTGGVTSQVSETFGAKPKAVTGTAPAKTGYTFKGYGTKADGTGTLYYDAKLQPTDTVWNEPENTTLHAVWTNNDYSVKFVDKDGKTLQEIKETYGKPVKQINKALLPTKAGYDFEGYADPKNAGSLYYDANGDPVKDKNGSTKNWDIADDVSLQPVWKYIPITVTVPKAISITHANVGKTDISAKVGISVENRGRHSLTVSTAGGELVSKDGTSKLKVSEASKVSFDSNDIYLNNKKSKDDTLQITGTAEYQAYSGSVTYSIKVSDPDTAK